MAERSACVSVRIARQVVSVRIDVILRRVRESTVALEKQLLLHILKCVCL